MQPKIAKETHYNRLIAVWTLYKREVWRFLKVWTQTVASPMITALLFMAVLSLAIGESRRGSYGMSFEQFLAPGLIMMAVIQNSFANTSSSLMLAKIQGVIIDILMPPFTGGEITIAFVMGGVTRGIFVAMATMFAMSLFLPIGIYSPFHAIFYIIVSSAILALLGCMAGIFASSFDQMAAITNYIITPLAFLSGTFYSINLLPAFWQKLSHIDPFFYMIDGFRYAMTGHNDGDIQTGMLLLLGLLAVLWLIVRWLFMSGWRLKN